MKFEKNIKENVEKTKNKEQSKVIKDSKFNSLAYVIEGMGR